MPPCEFSNGSENQMWGKKEECDFTKEEASRQKLKMGNLEPKNEVEIGYTFDSKANFR